MFRGSFGGKPILSSAHEITNLAQLQKPGAPNVNRANSFTNFLGREPGRGWLFMLRRDLNALDLNANQTLIFENETEAGVRQTVTYYGLVVAQEPIALTPSHLANDPDAAYLVEIADRRHLVCSRNFSVPTWNNYDSTKTWTNVVTDLWGLVGTHLGQASVPALPISPPGTPINVNFAGESAWEQLNRVLAFLGLALRCDLTINGNQFTIIQVGAADAVAAAQILALEAARRKIHDAEFINVNRGRVPAGVRVYFPQHPERIARDPYYVDVANPVQTGVEASLYVPLFDNTFAIYTAAGAVSNAAALSTQASARSTDYFRMLTAGGQRAWKRFSGMAAVVPGATIKQVTLAEQPGAGVYTDVWCNPYLMPEEVGFVRKPDPPRVGYAPVRLWVSDRSDTTIMPAYSRSGNTITFSAVGSVSIDGTATVLHDRIGVNKAGGHADCGIWEVSTKGTGGVAEVWIRTLDADNSDDFRNGLLVVVQEGGECNQGIWRVDTDDPIALNTTAVEFTKIQVTCPPYVRAGNDCVTAMGSAVGITQMKLKFIRESYDTDTFHSNTVNEDQFVVPTSGIYDVILSMDFIFTDTALGGSQAYVDLLAIIGGGINPSDAYENFGVVVSNIAETRITFPAMFLMLTEGDYIAAYVRYSGTLMFITAAVMRIVRRSVGVPDESAEADGVCPADASGGGDPDVPISTAALGTASTDGAAASSLALNNVTVAAGALLKVNVMRLSAVAISSVTIDGLALSLSVDGANDVIQTWIRYCPTTVTGDIVVTPASSIQMSLLAREIIGLATHTLDDSDSANGNDPALVSPGSITTTVAATFVEVIAGLDNTPTASQPTWTVGYTLGQSVTFEVAGEEFNLSESYKVLSAAGGQTATTGSTADAWEAIIAAFK